MKITYRGVISALPGLALLLSMTVSTLANADSPINQSRRIDPITVATDFDADGKGDLVLHDATLAKFYIRYSNSKRIGSIALGAVGDIPVIGDYDGDGQADLATFNPTTSKWTVRITGGTTRQFTLGDRGGFPAAADYAGKGCTQPAVYNPRLGKFIIADCDGSNPQTSTFGGSNGGRIAVPTDYDCDGEADLVVYSSYEGQWRVKLSSTGATQNIKFGQAGDLPIPGDYRNEGCSRLAVYRPTTGYFYVLNTVDDSTGAGSAFPGLKLGALGDRPVLANLNGDYTTDYAVYRPSTKSFYVYGNSKPIVFTIKSSQTASALPANPLAVSPLYALNRYTKGDYDRDGRSDLAAAERGSNSTQFKVRYRSNLGAERSVTLAAKGDAIVVGDYDGDGSTQPAVVTVVDSNTLRWTVKRIVGSNVVTDWGINGDQPFTGDMDCDGKSDIVVMRKTDGFMYWYVKLSSGGQLLSKVFGLSTDTPFIADVDGDSCDELVVSRSTSTGMEWYYKGMYDSSYISLKWGLATDTPLTPSDVNGDGVADFLVDRVANDLHKVYARYSRPEDNSMDDDDFGTETLTYGKTGDVLMAGKFDSSAQAELAVFRGTETPTGFYLNKLGRLSMFVAAGKSTDVILRPDGTVAEPSRSGGGTAGCNPTAGTPGDFYDGSGGSLWKPIAEGGIAPGKPTILLSSSYLGASISILDSDGEDLNAGLAYRSSYLPEYGRCSWNVTGYTASQLAAHSPITVKIVRRDGATECRIIENPTARND